MRNNETSAFWKPEKQFLHLFLERLERYCLANTKLISLKVACQKIQVILEWLDLKILHRELSRIPSAPAKGSWHWRISLL